MDGFLLVALVLIYLAISYVPISGTREELRRDERASQRNPRMDAARRP
jgi:hypothetical protein